MKIFSRILGCVIIYVALFLDETEEGRYQNKLEELWIRVRYGQDVALSVAGTLFVLTARTATRLFNWLFGTKLLSLRAATVSICLSLGSFFLFVPVLGLVVPSPVPLAERLSELLSAMLYIGFAITRALMDAKWLQRMWNTCFFFVLISNFGPIALYVFAGMGGRSGVRFIVFMALLFALSICCDLLFLGFLRWMLNRASRRHAGPFEIVAFLVLVCVVALSLVVFPFELMVKATPDPKHASVFAAVPLVLIVLNVVDVLLCLVVIAILAAFTIHRLVWASLSRPIYALARYGIVKRKKLLWTLGVTFLAGPTSAPSLWRFILHKLPGVF